MIRYTTLMDLEHILHRKHATMLVVGTVLSIAVVVVAAFLGRSALNLRGALLLPEPTDITAIAAIEPVIQSESDATIVGITLLRKQENPGSPKPSYDYLIALSDDRRLLIRLVWDMQVGRWSLQHREELHGGDSGARTTETPPSP